MANNNVNTNSITTNADANSNTATPEPTMNEEYRKKLKQRIAERAEDAKNSSSSTFIKLKDRQRFMAVFTGKVDEALVTFSKGDGKPVLRYNYEVMLLEDESGRKIQANYTTIFSASKTTSQQIDNLLDAGFQKLQVSRKGSGMTDTKYIVTPLPN